ERAGIDKIEADLVDQLRNCLLRLLVVALDRDADALAVAGGAAVVAQTRPEDRVERLHDARTREVGLQQVARGSAVAVELLELTVSLRTTRPPPRSSPALGRPAPRPGSPRSPARASC